MVLALPQGPAALIFLIFFYYNLIYLILLFRSAVIHISFYVVLLLNCNPKTTAVETIVAT